MQELNRTYRWPYIALASLCFALVCLLVPQVVCRYYTQQAYVALRRDNLDQARLGIEAARGWLVCWVFANDKKRIDIAEGDLAIRRAEKSKRVTDFLEEMQKAEQRYDAAVAVDPLDIDGYTGLARATAALEKVYPFVHKRPYSREALPVFEKLLALMPVNLYTHSLLTRYYSSRKMTTELNELVGRSIALYPQFYYQLKQQPFYSLAMNEMLKNSLQTAIDSGVYVEPAYGVLSALALQEEDYPGAIGYFLKTRKVTPYKDNTGYDLRLGELYLKAGRYAEAEQSFVDSLKTVDREGRLENIWNIYRSREAFTEFLAFCKRVDETENNVAEFLEILRGRCLIALDRYELATSHLARVSSPKYTGESLYLQACIAERQKDWDTMELRSQRATVLEPGNPRYHLSFSQALKNQQKWPQAEKAASAAIDSSAHPESWLFNHRAWIRWSNKNYQGARDDWEKAIGLSPDNAWCFYGMTLVYEQGGNMKAAIRQIEKALTLKPAESAFLKKHDQLQEKQHP